MARDKEEVQEFIISRLDSWFTHMDRDTEEYSLLSKAYDNIQTGCMLTRAQAKALENRLEEEARYQALTAHDKSGNFILAIDSLSIYPDVWAEYCRPGTYRIEL